VDDDAGVGWGDRGLGVVGGRLNENDRPATLIQSHTSDTTHQSVVVAHTIQCIIPRSDM